ncbi:hypothetical protein [Streptomyces sp. NRRL B-3229]|uniref:hypothetical protein n=1 Tax=Streptomyces sp. NRRL B-3229 TaxID=1463836 RepID=UPI0004C21726|nr:hypothetical protein [Streptomyces sp. NRRL B-3229]
MSEPESGLPPQAPPGVVAKRSALADKVCRELARAGFPVHRSDLGDGPHGQPGAKVYATRHVDGGVYVDWNTDAELSTAALDLFAEGIDYSNPPPVVRHHNTVVKTMQDALVGILASAGFQVEVPDGHTHGSLVRVTGSQP